MHEPSPQRSQLSKRQRAVLRLLAEGKSMKEAAAILQVTARTVAFHQYQMMRQLDIKTSAELVRFALRERSRDRLGRRARGTPIAAHRVVRQHHGDVIGTAGGFG